MLVDWPHLLPKQITSTQAEEKSLNPQLAIWIISRRDSAARAFQAKLQSLYLVHGEPKQINLTTRSLGSGIADVVDGICHVIFSPPH